MKLPSLLIFALLPCLATSTFSQGTPAFVPNSGPAQSQPLVPAALGLRTDRKGNSWNFQQNGTLGRIGSSMMNTGLALYINNSQFYSQYPMMTQDGKEFVLAGRQGSSFGGLQVTRRMQLDERQGVLRTLEIFQNPSSADISASIEIRTNFSGNYKTYVTNQGTPSVNVLERSETGVLVTPSSSNQNEAYVFNFRSPKSTITPTLTSQSRYVVSAHYQVVVPAGETVCLLHTTSQVPIPSNFDRKTLSQIFRPTTLQRHLATVPKELRPKIANFSLGNETQGLALLSATSIDSLGVQRSRKDVLAVGETTRLVGSAACGNLTIKSDFGESEVQFEEIAAVVGGNRGRRDRGKIFLRDGQVLGGNIQAEGFRFVLHSGNVMELDVRNLDRLVKAAETEEQKWPEKVAAYVETHSGDRLAVEMGSPSRLTLVSPWGSVEVGLDDVLAISTQESEPVGHLVELRNGSRFFAFLGDNKFAFNNPDFGLQELAASQIHAIVTRQAIEEQSSEDSFMEWQSPRLTQPYITLRGQQRLVGRVMNPEITLLAEGEWLRVDPETVRYLLNLSEDFEMSPSDSPRFRAELWGGGLVGGYVRERTLDAQMLDTTWRVPVSEIYQIVVPTPRISDSARKSIAEWIRKLGDDEWELRERSTEELAEFGYLAKPQLLDALGQTSDPEVARRLEILLGRLE